MTANESSQIYSTVDSSLPAKGVIPRKVSSTRCGKPCGISYDSNVAIQCIGDERTRVSPWEDPSISGYSSIRLRRSLFVVESGISRIRRHLNCFWRSLGFLVALCLRRKKAIVDSRAIITDESTRYSRAPLKLAHMVFSILLSTLVTEIGC